MSATKEHVPYDFIYTGLRMAADRSLCVSLRTIAPDGVLSKELLYDSKRIKHLDIVGGIYRGALFDFAPDGTTTSRGVDDAIYQRKHSDTGAIIEWQALSENAEVTHRLLKLEKDERRTNEIERVLLPLRKQYAAAERRHDIAVMTALERAVVRALRISPRSHEEVDQ